MLVIFKKIRQRLFIGNKAGKYLTYAFGEIILVVIGILIAVQVNNWNIQRKQIEKEKEYLSEIKKNLSQDKLAIDNALAYNLKKDSCINQAIILLALDIDNSERVFRFYKLFNTLSNYVIFMPNNIAFKNMINAESIDLIRHDSLRKAISDYYQNEGLLGWGTQENTKNVTRQFTDEVSRLLVCKELASHFVGSDLDFKFQRASVNEFHKDPMVMSKLGIMKGNLLIQNDLLEGTREEVMKIMDLLSEIE